METDGVVDAAGAEAAKAEANALFQQKHYAKALEAYDRAIQLNANNAVYFANRAFAHIRLEELGSAVADATEAIRIDPTYAKGYYRRGSANMLMGKFKLALKDFKQVARANPKDPDARKKLAECEKEVRRINFELAIGGPEEVIVPASDTIDLDTMAVDSSYDGPRMEFAEDGETYRATPEFVRQMMAGFRDQKLLHRRFAFQILLEARKILMALPSLVDVRLPEDGAHGITVCGDTHGQFYDLLNIFEMNGEPSPTNPYLFNGDFVDRGSWSCEVIMTLLAWKVVYPDSMHLTRGNHETKGMNRLYGFDGEVKHKYTDLMLDVFREVFQALPLAYTLHGRVFVCHGGLFSRDDVTLDEIRAIDRFSEPPDEGIFTELLWSDPQSGDDSRGREASKRGVGVQFGSDVTARFLDNNGLDLLVRSHEVKDEGYEVDHFGRCITIFSAPNYVDSAENKAAFIHFSMPEMKPNFTQFDAVWHPDVQPMAYASNMFNMFG
ncbi:serine/threonine-protein phosphatase [Pycnococcus provasolii]